MAEILTTLVVLILVGVGWWSWTTRHGLGAGGPGGGVAIGERVLVAVSHPASAESLGEVAAALARGDAGCVTALTVLDRDDVDDVRPLSREAIRRCQAVAVEAGVEADGRLRVDSSVAAGILHQTVESDASLLVLGWPRLGLDHRPAPAVADAVAGVPCPLLLARLQGYRWRRIVLRMPNVPDAVGLEASVRLATDVAERLSRQHGIPVARLRAADVSTADPTDLLVAPVDPLHGAVERALREANPLGDVLLALCHGPDAVARRELLSTAAGLYERQAAPRQPADRSP